MATNTSLNTTAEVQTLLAAELLVQPDDLYLFRENGPIETKGPEMLEPGTKIVTWDRPTLETGTYSEASRRLVEGTAIASTAKAIALTQVSLTTREYGGPHDGTNVNPFGFSEFLAKRSKHDFVKLVGEFLRRDYNRFHDTAFRDLLLTTTNVATPDDSAEGAIAAGQTMSMAFLRNLNKAMKDLKVPAWPNGNWRLIISTRDEKYLKADAEYRAATNYLTVQNPMFRGHVMSVEGFDIMVTTNNVTKAVGAASAVTGYQGVAFGPYGIGHGIPMAPTVAAASDTDFGRQERLIWKSHEAIGLLYTDLVYRTVTT